MTTPHTERTCFFVGVSGYMELVADEAGPLTECVRQLFRFLRNGAAREPLGKLVEDLVPDAKNRKLRRTYRAALSRWPGLGRETPIVVMCNLAPGVDTLVANLVLDEFANDNIHLLCPLPFPPQIYIGASTFVRSKDDRPAEGDLQRQQDFLSVLAKMGAIPQDMVSRANGTKHLPEQLEQALKAVSPETFFAVRLQEDLRLNAAELDEKWRDDRDDSDRRNRRYYAAGEYLSVSAHLLVAIWNGQRDGSRSGTSTVVEARLSGPRQGLLPTTLDVALQHGGPVWHLLANRPDSSQPANVNQCAETRAISTPLPPLRILHPARDCPQAVIVAGNQPANMVLQSDRLRLFARVGESLRNFNNQTLPSQKDRRDEFHKMLTERPAMRPSLAALLEQENPRLHERLRTTSDIRRRSSDLTDFYQQRVKRTMARLFWITFLAAVALHFLTHWHPRHDKHNDEPTHAATEGAAPREEGAENEPEQEQLNRVQIVAGWLALALTAVAIGYFAWQRSRKLEAHGHDARAISEGLRVQFYWNLAGLGKSVSANYLSRHRSELDWIRGVIRATSIPYDIWVDWFGQLPPAVKVRAFRVIQTAWVQEQLAYFRRASHREHHRLHVWHTLGGVAALGGVLAYLKLVSHESWPAIAHFVELVCNGWVALVLLAATGIVALFLATRNAVDTAAAGHGDSPGIFPELKKSIREARDRADKKWKKPATPRLGIGPVRAVMWSWEWLKSAPGIFLELVNILVPSPRNPIIAQTRFVRRLWHSVLNFLGYLPLALAVACIATAVAHLTASSFTDFPSPLTLTIILAGMLLLGGALSVAWAEKNLHSELAYQYNVMAILFESADQQLDKELTALEAAIEASDNPAQQASLQRIQALLFKLGQEALDENAEWLLLHRARPLEPVMAG